MLRVSPFRILIPAVILLLLLPGCSASSFYINPAEKDYELNIKRLNYLGNTYSSSIFLDSIVIKTPDIRVSGDSLIYTDSETEQIMWIPVSRVQKIEIRDNVNRVFNTIWYPILTIAGTGVISIISGNIAPALAGALVSPAAGIYGFFFTGYKEFIFIHMPGEIKANLTCPCQKKKY